MSLKTKSSKCTNVSSGTSKSGSFKRKANSTVNLPFVRGKQRYFTNRTIPKEDENYEIMAKPYKVPKTPKLISFAKFYQDKRRDEIMHYNLLKVHKKDNARLSQGRHFNKRLFIEDQPSDIKTTTMIHPEFFGIVDGRPIRSIENIVQYRRDLACIAMTTQDIGYMNDMKLRIELTNQEEMAKYERTHSSYKELVRNFQQYLAADHASARRKISEAQKKAEMVEEINMLLDLMKIEEIKLRNFILRKYDILKTLKLYKYFLYHIAPQSWRKVHDPYFDENEVFRHKFDSEKFTEGAYLIDELIEKAKQRASEKNEHQLYFSSPDQIKYTFRSIELQGQFYAVHLSKRYDITYMLKKKGRKLKELVIDETCHFDYYVKYFEGKVEREEKNARYLKELFFKLLNGTYREMVSSIEVLRLSLCVTYVAEKVFHSGNLKFDSILQAMTAIEQEYLDINAQLDALDPRIVNGAKAEYFEMYNKQMREAEIASITLKRLDELVRSLKIAFDPPAHLNRVKPKAIKRKHKESKKYIYLEVQDMLEESLKKELALFTDWCHGESYEDKLRLYQSFVKPFLEIEG